MLELFPSLLLSAAGHRAVAAHPWNQTVVRVWSTREVLERALFLPYFPAFLGALLCVVVGLWSVRPATHRKIVGGALLAAAVAALGLAALFGLERAMRHVSLHEELVPPLPTWVSALGNACVVGELLLAVLLGYDGLQEWRRRGGPRAPLAVLGLTVAVWVGWTGYDPGSALMQLVPNLVWAGFVTLVLLQLWGRRRVAQTG